MKYILKILKIFNKKFLIKKTGGFWSNYNIKSGENYIIDLSVEEISHFGDNLFFISAFYGKDCKNFTFLVSKKYYFLWEKFGISNVLTSIDIFNPECIYVSSFETKIINRKISQRFKKKITFDFTDVDIDMPLYKKISSFFGVENNSSKPMFVNYNISEKIKQISKKSFFLFNDIIYSRSFLRKYLSKKLTPLLKEKFDNNEKIFFIGSNEDLKYKNYHKKISDLRGKTSFEELIYLIQHENCKAYIGLDNGLMHLSLLMNKKSYILFRGKFSKKQSNHHFECINISMNENAQKNIQYI